jgi:predicted xylose isomerase-like sugar epimerase
MTEEKMYWEHHDVRGKLLICRIELEDVNAINANTLAAAARQSGAAAFVMAPKNKGEFEGKSIADFLKTVPTQMLKHELRRRGI